MAERPNRSYAVYGLLVGLVIGLIAGYLLWQTGARRPDTAAPETGRASTAPAAPSEMPPEAAVVIGAVSPITPAESASHTQTYVEDFFAALEASRPPDEKTPTISATELRALLTRLAAHPPVPAGEAAGPQIILRNIYHLYRTLGLKDLLRLKTLLRSRQADLEEDLRAFYALGSPKDPGAAEPWLQPQVWYTYAGFFLNTVGGRCYLFRRDPMVRLLLSYYCARVIHTADVRGINRDGIDLVPLLKPLRDELTFRTDLRYQAEYISTLDQLRAYYAQRGR